MKSIATILFAFISVLIVAQTKLDTLVFNKVNEYRVSMGKSELKWNPTCFKASERHTNYLYGKNCAVWPNSFSGHTEDTLVDPVDRFEFFSKEKWASIGEVALAISENFASCRTKIGDSLICNKIATEIVDGWKSSKTHNKIILSDNYTFGGVSCRYFIKPSGLRTIDSYRIMSTMVLLKK